MSRLRKPRFFWVYPLALWLFLVARTTESSLRLGVVLVLLGETLRLWANGYVGHMKVNLAGNGRNEPKIGQLITSGPYAYVRHPLYVGTVLIRLGFCTAANNPLLLVGAAIFFLAVYPPKVLQEELILSQECGEAYQAYERAVPRWVPSFRRCAQPHGQWSWEGIWASQEPKTLAWVVVGLIALYFREEGWQEHQFFTSKRWLKHAVLAALLVLLVAGDGIFELVKRIRNRAGTSKPRAGRH